MAAFQPIQPPTTEVPPLKDSEHIKDTIVAVEEQPEQGAAAVEVAKYDDEEVPSLKQEDAPVSLQPTEVEVTKVPVPEVHGAVLETPSFEAPTTDLATKDVTLSADTTKAVDESDFSLSEETAAHSDDVQNGSVTKTSEQGTTAPVTNGVDAIHGVSTSEDEASTKPASESGDKDEATSGTLAPSLVDSSVDASIANPVLTETHDLISTDTPSSPSLPKTLEPEPLAKTTETEFVPLLSKEESGVNASVSQDDGEVSTQDTYSTLDEALKEIEDLPSASANPTSDDKALGEPNEAKSSQDSVSPVEVQTEEVASERVSGVDATPVAIAPLDDSKAKAESDEETANFTDSVAKNAESNGTDAEASSSLGKLSDDHVDTAVAPTEQSAARAKSDSEEELIQEETPATKEDTPVVDDVVTPASPLVIPVADSDAAVASKVLSDVDEQDHDPEQVAPNSDATETGVDKAADLPIPEESNGSAIPSGSADLLSTSVEEKEDSEKRSEDLSEAAPEDDDVVAAVEPVISNPVPKVDLDVLADLDAQPPVEASQVSSAGPLATSKASDAEEQKDEVDTLAKIVDEPFTKPDDVLVEEREPAATEVAAQEPEAKSPEAPAATVLPSAAEEVSPEESNPFLTSEEKATLPSAEAAVPAQEPTTASSENAQDDSAAVASSPVTTGPDSETLTTSGVEASPEATPVTLEDSIKPADSEGSTLEEVEKAAETAERDVPAAVAGFSEVPATTSPAVPATTEEDQAEGSASASEEAQNEAAAAGFSLRAADIPAPTGVADEAPHVGREDAAAGELEKPLEASDLDVPAAVTESAEVATVIPVLSTDVETEEGQVVPPANASSEDSQALPKDSDTADFPSKSADVDVATNDDVPTAQVAEESLEDSSNAKERSLDTDVDVTAVPAEAVPSADQIVPESAKDLPEQEDAPHSKTNEVESPSEAIGYPVTTVSSETEDTQVQPSSTSIDSEIDDVVISAPIDVDAQHTVGDESRDSSQETDAAVAEEVSHDEKAGASSSEADAETSTQDADQRARSPWTASYSVTSQGAVDADGSAAQQTETGDDEVLAGHEDVDVDAGVVPSNKQDELAVPTELSATIVRVESDADESISHPAESVLKETHDTNVEAQPESNLQRPWTPSYSVSTQGSPKPSNAVLEDEPVTDIEATSTDAAQPLDAEVAESSAPVHLFSPVLEDTQEEPADSAVVTAAKDDAEVEPASETRTESTQKPTEEVDEITHATTGVESVSAPISLQELADPVHNTETPVISLPEEQTSALADQGTASSWAQSYSVSSQGSPLVQTRDVEPLIENETDSTQANPEPSARSISPAIHIQPAEAATFSDVAPSDDKSGLVGTESAQQPTSPLLASPSPRPWTPSYSVNRQGTPSPEPSLHESASEPVDIPAEPTRAWTPSYSVSRQGTPSPEPSVHANVTEPVDIPAGSSEQVAEISETSEDHDIANASSPSIQIEQSEDVVLAAPIPIRPGEILSSEEKATSPPLASPSPRAWTPSYSVSRQGSPSPEATGRNIAADNAGDASPVNPQWTPSYSVSRQGSPLPSHRETDAPPADVNAVPVIITAPDSSSEGVRSTEQSLQLGNSSVPANDPSEEPTSPPLASPSPRPWTPSYSVSNQGSPMLKGDQPLETEESATPAVQQPVADVEKSTAVDSGSQALAAEDTKPSETWTPSYSVTSVGAGPQGTDNDLSANHAPTTEQQATEPLSDQLPPATKGTETPGESFPTSEEVDQLEPLKLNTDTQSTSTRARYESTTSASSRFFPGGWFSSTPPVEGKPSLDSARGEFSATKSPTSPTTEEPLAVPAEDDGEKKHHKWCTIM